MPFTTIRRRHNRGFTLIETLIVIASLAVIGLAIYSTLSSGVRIWRKLGSESSAEDVAIFYEKIKYDLRNTIVYKSIGFSGEDDKLVVATLVKSPRLKIRTVGMVEYSFDEDEDSLVRKVTDFSGIYEDRGPNIRQSVLRDVKSVSFEYYTYDKGMKQYFWHDEWSESTPMAVKVDIELERDGKSASYSQTIGIPVGA